MRIGYARTSTADQQAGLQAQQRDLQAAGCERFFVEHVSGKSAQRHCWRERKPGERVLARAADEL